MWQQYERKNICFQKTIEALKKELAMSKTKTNVLKSTLAMYDAPI